MSLPGAGLVARFLGATRRKDDGPQGEVEQKRRERGFASRVPFALGSAMRALGELTGRHLSPVERYETAHADEVVVAVGHAVIAALAAALAMRGEGRRVGAVGVRALRPFFGAEAVKAIARARAVAVIEPLDVALAPSGPLATSLKAAFADALTWAPGFPGVGGIRPYRLGRVRDARRRRGRARGARDRRRAGRGRSRAPADGVRERRLNGRASRAPAPRPPLTAPLSAAPASSRRAAPAAATFPPRHPRSSSNRGRTLA